MPETTQDQTSLPMLSEDGRVLGPEHPHWCAHGYCEVQPDPDFPTHPWGEHIGVVGPPLHAGSGNELQVGLSGGAFDGLYVHLTLAGSTDCEGEEEETRWRRGERAWLEPEEARLLARRLLAAADEWEQVVAGRAGTRAL